ncbi:MAG: hypothetical protein IJK62_14470 [Bacteroidales bacterium]|nr:hypothetical protein [Bacteroidales bacterium]
MTWLWVIIVIALIGGVIGFLISNDGERGSGFLGGFLTAGVGCGTIVFKIFIAVGLLLLTIKLFIWLFS